MKLDMKFGWRPEFNDRDRLNRKEAIAIKLTYPINIGLLKQSVRGGPLFSEIYRMNKSKKYDNLKFISRARAVDGPRRSHLLTRDALSNFHIFRLFWLSVNRRL